MTVLPAPPGRVLTVTGYVALGEDDEHRFELRDGNLVSSPSPTPITATPWAGEFGYADAQERTGTLSVSRSFPLTVDLDALL